MKLQNLAIIFVIIMLPISLILSEYMKTQMKTLSLQSSYDSQLSTATYDAIKAFQLNTINSDTSDIANSRIRDIEASVNTFFNSIATKLNVSGYTKEELKTYVPALVYTMYDGYYIYSPYKNNLTSNEDTYPETQDDGSVIDVPVDDPAKNGEYLFGIKPYIYYSCRYKNPTNSNTDFVIYYSLDNYISIKGMINGKYVNDAGYLIDNIQISGDNITYRGIQITEETILQEYLEDGKLYKYTKINGTKWYKGEDGRCFTNLNKDRLYTATDEIKNILNMSTDDNAKKYYQEAASFTDRVRNQYGLKNIDLANWAVAENGITYSKQGITFMEGKAGTNIASIEEEKSNFNQHRLEVIKNSISTNLTAAIANYNENLAGAMGNTTTTFTMPNLQADEWEKLLHEVCLVSFMQGVSIGGKIYNGYSIVTNSKTKEVVSEKSIFITEKNDSGLYYRVGDKTIATSFDSNNYIGYLNIDLERRTRIINSQNNYYYPHKQLGSYTSIMSSLGMNTYENIYEYLNGKNELAKIYYTALGRERRIMSRIK